MYWHCPFSSPWTKYHKKGLKILFWALPSLRLSICHYVTPPCRWQNLPGLNLVKAGNKASSEHGVAGLVTSKILLNFPFKDITTLVLITQECSRKHPSLPWLPNMEGDIKPLMSNNLACWSDCNTSQFVRWDNVGVPSSSWFAWCGCSVPTSNGVIADASSEKSATFVTVLHAKPAVDCIKCYINNDMNDHILWNAFQNIENSAVLDHV